MGKFEHEEPVLALSVDKIEIEALEGQDYTGEFVITSQNGVKMKGLVYSNHPHMECLTPQFKGEEVRIRYQFHSEGLLEGDIQKGEFSIICNQGEYSLSFVVSISRRYADTSVGRVRSLHDFAKLAGNSWQEAYQVFASSGFSNLFQEGEETERLYYEGFAARPVSMTNMEEFLVSIKKKEPVRFSIEEPDACFEDLEESQKEAVEIRKNNWGWLELKVSSQDEFLQPLKTRLTSEDFVGSVCRLEYMIDKEKLHDGRNFGRMIISNAYQTSEVVVVVNQHRKGAVTAGTHWEIQKGRKELTELYISYRLKKIGSSMWASKSIGILNHLLAIDEENQWFRLMKVQAFLVGKQKQEAEWLLDEYRRYAEDTTTPEYGYYLYLCTLYEREPSYVNRLAQQIEEIYRKHESSNVLFWIRLFVKKEYCENSAQRLHALRQRITAGCHSPFLFMEAYYIYWQNPYLLTRLGEFEIQVLYWAGRHGMLTEELALDVVSLAGNVRTYQSLFYQVLELLYNRYEKPQLLSAICSYLIRTQRFAPKYHIWYERGIEEDLRIAGINEAYLMSMDEQNMKKMPRMVQMYFQYNTNIPYKQKAALLVNIIAGKEEEPTVYQNYRRIMEEFALEQIREGHMDDNLAVVYGDLLDKGMIQKSMVHALSRILYTVKLTVNAVMAKVYVLHRQLKEVQVVPVIHATAYFQLYSKDYAVIFEDTEGRRYAGGISYELKRLLNPGQYLRKCMGYAPYEASFLLQHFSGREKSLTFMPQDRDYLLQLLSNAAFRDTFRARLYPEVISYLNRMDEPELVEDYLDQVPLAQCGREARAYLIEQLIDYHKYDLAYEAVHNYGIGQISPSKLAALCSYEIGECEQEEDDFLINLTSYVFRQGKYSEQTLDYLQRYYGGPTKSMCKLWQSCFAFEVDTSELEERLLVQMLYTTEFVANVEDIYESFCAHGGIEVVREAYLSYFSYMYLVKKSVVPHQMFPEIMQRIYEERDVPDVCRLALLFYFTEENEWSAEKCDVAFLMVREYVRRGMYFAFYQNLPQQIKDAFQLYDKVFLEYRTNPKKRVLLHYRMEGQEEFAGEEMNDAFEGIFVHAFTIFFGEAVEYYITEEGEHQVLVESGRIGSREIGTTKQTNRYELLNTMLFEQTLGEKEKLEELMEQYSRQEAVNESLFRLM